MAYKLLYDNEILFDPYSDNIVTDAQLTAKYNNPDYFDFTVSMTNSLYNKLAERSGLVELFYNEEKIFEGLITSIEMDLDGNKSVKCSGPLEYLSDTLVRPYSTKAGESQTLAPDTVSGIFQWYIDQHNEHTLDPKKQFTVGINQGSMLATNNSFTRTSDSLPTTWNEIKSAILEDLGGFIFVEHKDSTKVLNLYGDIHEMNTQIIDFGVNITDFSKTSDTADQYTAIRPSGYTPDAPENDKDKKMYPITISNLQDTVVDSESDLIKKGDVIYSISAVQKYGYKEYAYSNKDIEDETSLLKAAAILLKTMTAPAESITVKAIDLALYMNGYKHLRVGQAVRIRSKLHSIDEYMMVNSITLDVNDPSQTEYELGVSYESLTGQQSSYLRSLNAGINSALDSVSTLDQTTKDTAILAGNANTAAQGAVTTATEAKKTADDAHSTAVDANETANTANTTANKANETANESKNIANSAVETANNAETKADTAVANTEKFRSELQTEMDSVKSDADELSKIVEANKQAAEESISSLESKVKSAEADINKSIQDVDSKADAAKQAAAEAQSKAESVASDLESSNAVIERHSTELGELTTKVSNAGTKADSAVTVATEAKQTATEASTKATSAYNDSQTALTQSTTATQTATSAKTTAESAAKTANDSLKQSSTAVQTANQVSTKLTTEYQTKADADKIYATQSSVSQTSDSIKSEVAKTYATKDALTALQNVADNAIESWRGSGVPTLSNKPASDWTTAEEKKKHSGDLYYDKATGKAYRFGSDDGTTYSWELNQDSDVTKALQDASKAQSTADGAQSTADKANTAADKAQTTANTAVSNAATAKSAADAAQSSANAAQSDVDKLKVDIPATYATKSSVEQTASEITASVESVKTTANGAVTAASKAQQTADGISTTLTKDYQTKTQADATYATQASLKATSESITADVSKAQSTADGAVTAASKAQQTADAVTLNLSKNYSTKAQTDSTYATQTNLKATSDSLTAKITANATKAQSALDKATTVETNLDGFKTTVSETYATNAKVDGISVGGTNLLLDTKLMKITGSTTHGGMQTSSFKQVENHSGSLWARGGEVTKTGLVFGQWIFKDFALGDEYTLSFYVDSDVANRLECYFYGASGYVTVNTATCSGGAIRNPKGYSDGNTTLTIAAAKKQRVWVTWKINASGDATIPKYVLIRGDNTTVNSNVYVYGVKLEKGSKPTDWSPAPEDLQPAGDYATNSSLEQTASSITAKVTEVADTAAGAVTKATTAQQTADGIKTTLSKDYTTTADADKKYSTKTELTTEAGRIRTELSETTTTANGALSKATSLESTVGGIQSTISEQATTLDATVKTANEAKSTADSNKTTISQVSTTASNALSKATTVESSLDGFKTTVSETYQAKADMSTYSTKSYVDETSKSVALGVVQDYKGADGSGLATKSEVSATKDSIALAVQGTYTGDDDSLKSLQSSLDITRDKVTIAFSNAEAAAGVGTQLSEYQTANDTNVTDLTERLNAEIAARQAYITFGQDSNNPVMEMGAASSTAKMRLTNTQMQFLIGSVIAAYISNDRLNINNADILQTLRIGKYAFVPRSDGHMSLKYVG